MLRLQKDERLVALIRAGNDRAFEVLFDRYQARLLAFCRSMLRSEQDAEDVLQEVMVNAHAAMLADKREIKVRAWLYRICRNRCLNHLRRPVPDGQDSMDTLPHQHGTSTGERVEQREQLRHLLSDVKALPETQRTALCLREIDQLSYQEMAQAMETTIPSIKSLLVRARIGLAESTQARLLTCDEVRLQLAEAAEGIAKATGPVRKHVRGCEACKAFRTQLRSDQRALAALVPLGPLALFKTAILGKLGFGGSTGTAATASGGTLGAGAGATGGLGAATTGIGGLGAAIGTKAATGVATAAILTAGAVEVKHYVAEEPSPGSSPPAVEALPAPAHPARETPRKHRSKPKQTAAAATSGVAAAPEAEPEATLAEPEAAAATEAEASEGDQGLAPPTGLDPTPGGGAEGSPPGGSGQTSPSPSGKPGSPPADDPPAGATAGTAGGSTEPADPAGGPTALPPAPAPAQPAPESTAPPDDTTAD